MGTKKGLNTSELCKAFRKGNYQPLYFLYGQETFLMDEVQQVLIKHALAEHERDFNYSLVYGADADGSAVITLCKSFPMMSERRVVVVRDFGALKNNQLFGDYAKEPNLSSVVLLLCRGKPRLNTNPYAALKRLATWSECKPLSKGNMSPWIKRRTQQLGCTIESEAADRIISYVGTDLNTTANEIDKLVTYVGERKEITADDVIRAAGQTLESNVFELQDAISEGRLRDAHRISGRLLSEGANKRGEALKIVAILGSHFIRLWKLYGCQGKHLANAEIARRTGIPLYFVPKYRATLRRFSHASLERIFSALLAVDYELKGGGRRSERLIITMLIQRLALETKK